MGRRHVPDRDTLLHSLWLDLLLNEAELYAGGIGSRLSQQQLDQTQEVYE